MVAAEFINEKTKQPDSERCSAVIKHCLEESKVIMLNAGTYGNIIRFLPPLVINEDEMNLVLEAISKALKATS